jgi:hypothetical protein
VTLDSLTQLEIWQTVCLRARAALKLCVSDRSVILTNSHRTFSSDGLAQDRKNKSFTGMTKDELLSAGELGLASNVVHLSWGAGQWSFRYLFF